MKRTNVYLEDDQLRLLKHIAVEENRSFTDLVRQALQEFLERYQQKTHPAPAVNEWQRRLDRLLAQVHERTAAFSAEEIEADITAASEESRRQRRDVARRG